MFSNKLLQKQINKFISDDLISKHPELKLFLQAVNNSYNSYEKDIELSNHAFLLSEKEYRSINTKLAKEIGQKKLSIQKLKQTIQSIDANSNIADDTNDDILDVTEYFVTQLQKRKDAETELLKSASLIGSLLKNLHAAILVENENRQIVLTNQMFCDMFNIPVPPDLLIGVDCTQSAEQSKLMFINPDEFVKNVEEILENKQIVKDEVLELADGRFFERDYIPIYVEEVYKGHLWTYRDVTERRTAEEKIKLQEEKYRSIIANMNLGLLEVDLNDKIIYVNQSFCEMSGFSTEELIDNKATNLFVKHPNEISLIKNKTVERTKGVSDSYEMKVLNKNNETRWWLISGAPLYNNEKKQVGSIGIHLDITEQKELETQRKNQQKQKRFFLPT